MTEKISGEILNLETLSHADAVVGTGPQRPGTDPGSQELTREEGSRLWETCQVGPRPVST